MTPFALPTPAPAWTRRTGVVVVGSGAAGLAATVHLAAAGVPTMLLTRARLTDTATDWAQGGMAAVWSADDSTAAHLADTLEAGAGLCEPEAARILVEEAPASLRRLIDLGAQFDRDATGAYDLHLEGGHSARRILHAGGDASGHEVEETLAGALTAAVRDPESTVEVFEHLRALDLLTVAGRVAGVRVRQPDGTIGEVYADAVVLASGGIGQLWPLTTNPAVATGDGIAMAFRAGAMLRDLEFVQFHPTVLWIAPERRIPGDRGVLISEAVRGEGAVLIDRDGRRVMAGRHPRADLAPRDVVSATMEAHLHQIGDTHLFLDARHFGERVWQEKFPSILAMCRERDIDPVTEPIPVHPGAHYLCGGIAADMDGRTSLPGLYAVGEVAATGVQGANRLASNSVTEGLVAGDRLGALLTRTLTLTYPGRPDPARTVDLIAPAERDRMRQIMGRGVEVARTEAGLAAAGEALATLQPTTELTDDAVDVTNLHTVARLVQTAALHRTESRGCHRRADHPERNQNWLRHVTLVAGTDAQQIVVGTQPLDADPELFHHSNHPQHQLQEALA